MSSRSKYSKRSFWSKVKHHAKAIGKSTLTKAFTLYNTFNDERTPAWAKATIAGALAYLILPTDAIPDFLPVVGFTDDAATLAAAAGTVAAHVRSSHKRDAKQQVKDFSHNSFPNQQRPNHALQRTAPHVTAPASTAAFPPTVQVPRRAPRSLSLGSLGVATPIPK